MILCHHYLLWHATLHCRNIKPQRTVTAASLSMLIKVKHGLFEDLSVIGWYKWWNLSIKKYMTSLCLWSWLGVWSLQFDLGTGHYLCPGVGVSKGILLWFKKTFVGSPLKTKLYFKTTPPPHTHTISLEFFEAPPPPHTHTHTPIPQYTLQL